MTVAFVPHIEAMLAAQERFEALREGWFQRAGSMVCDLSYANPADGLDPVLLAELAATLHDARPAELQYAPYGGLTVPRRLIAQQLDTVHPPGFNWKDVVLTPGAMAALNVALSVARTDDEPAEVIIPTPCWLDYPLYARQLGLQPVLVPLKRDGFHLDLDAIARAITPHTRALILSQPSNPSGVLYDDSELAALGALLRSRAVGGRLPLLVSDEAHRDVVYPPRRFVSPLAHYSEACVVYSFGKALLLQGQRLGYVAVSPQLGAREQVRRHFERACRAMGYCTPTSLMQLAIPRLLRYALPLERFARRRTHVIDRLTAQGYDVVASDGTFFVYVQVPSWCSSDEAFVEHLAKLGVFVLPASVFHDRGAFRISLTATDETIERALPIFAAAVEARA